MAWVVHRKMIDSDGDRMEGYLTPSVEYGTFSEAFIFNSYEDAEYECRNAAEYYEREYPDDRNDFDVLEVDD